MTPSIFSSIATKGRALDCFRWPQSSSTRRSRMAIRITSERLGYISFLMSLSMPSTYDSGKHIVTTLKLLCTEQLLDANLKKGCLIRVCIGIILSESLRLKSNPAKLLAALQHFVSLLGVPFVASKEVKDSEPDSQNNDWPGVDRSSTKWPGIG